VPKSNHNIKSLEEAWVFIEIQMKLMGVKFVIIMGSKIDLYCIFIGIRMKR
jgi:hypothetical protein